MRREFDLKDTNLRVELEIEREAHGVMYRFVRKWDVRHRPPKVLDPAAPLESRIDISPSESFACEEKEHISDNLLHKIGIGLVTYAPFATLLFTWGEFWKWSLLSILLGIVSFAFSWYGFEKRRFDEVVEAKRRVRKYSTERYNEGLRNLSWWKALSGVGFERAVADVFSMQEFSVEVTPRSGDGGVDLFMSKRQRRILAQ